MKVKTENLPKALKEQGVFCPWKYFTKRGSDKPSKMPYNANDPTEFGDSSDRTKFGGLDAVIEAAEYAQILGIDFDGIGLGVFAPISGIDIDHCIDAEGNPSEMAADIISIMGSYTEISPSGTGIHIYFTVPQGFSYDKEKYYIKHDSIECYVPGMTARFLTVTGNRIRGCLNQIPDRSDQLMKVLEKYMIRPRSEQVPQDQTRIPVDLSDRDLIQKASKNPKFAALFSGSIMGYPSHSEADSALCYHLAFWTGRDPDRMDSLFRASGLFRPKWDQQRGSKTYGEMTIESAIRNCVDVYEPYKPPTASDLFGKPDQGNPDTAPSDPQDMPVSLTEIAQNALATASSIDSINAREYLENGRFEKEIAYFTEFKSRKTGFSGIDRYLTLYPGLAVLGGCASLGKTTFAMNLTENLLKRGEKVIYFALEQDPIELISKMVSRRVFEQSGYDPQKTKYRNIDIKNGANGPEIQEAIKAAAADAESLEMIRCDFQVTAEQICRYIRESIEADPLHRKPIVFIDYLQLIAPDPTMLRSDQRTQIDFTVKRLKTIQRELGILIVMVSNFNRSAYNTPVSYESFKESGLIEFTCDYVWGLQLKVLSNPEYYRIRSEKTGLMTQKGQSDDVRFKMMTDAQKSIPKSVEFISLKSRNGVQSYSVNFNYWVQYDCYLEPQLFIATPQAQEQTESESNGADLPLPI